MSIKTKRWNDPAEPDDGWRLLVCRYRPRGLRKGAETWDDWWPALGPSAQLLADFHGKHGPPIKWAAYRTRYREEMALQAFRIRAVAEKAATGESITLLCSAACTDIERCHRKVLAELVTAVAAHIVK